MLPLRIKTMQSGLKMQRIQPQMDAIKEKYKKYKATDPKRNEMNVEIMKLQKDNGVNMFGGCIPTLIQLPLLFAFFSMLPRVVELRHAHWLWLPDLTSPDPWHILPILMVDQLIPDAVLHAVTRRRPAAAEDDGLHDARRLRLLRPGTTAPDLALYWAVGNLFGIAQQMVMNRTSLGREMREIAAKRARRKAGAPATLQGKR